MKITRRQLRSIIAEAMSKSPDWKWTAFEGREPTEDEIKLMDAFMGSGVQALELAEMTGNDEMAAEFHKIIDPIRDRIAKIENAIEDIQNGAMKKKKLDKLADALEKDVPEMSADTWNSWFEPDDHWIDSIYEMADNIWYHGIDFDSYNVASETKSKQDLDKIKMWAGVA